MSERNNNQRLLAQASTRAAVGLRQHIAVWLAILGLYIQLAAAGVCNCGLPVPSGAAALFPICHGQSTDQSAPQSDDHSPLHHEQCPFCPAHCHAAMVKASGSASVQRVHVVSLQATPAVFVIPHASRFAASAQPRGPPALF